MSLGHGHVVPRSDGFKAQCGGPQFCAACAGELFDHTQRMNHLMKLYQFSYEKMTSQFPESKQNGYAHRAGLLAVYMAGLGDANAKP